MAQIPPSDAARAWLFDAAPERLIGPPPYVRKPSPTFAARETSTRRVSRRRANAAGSYILIFSSSADSRHEPVHVVLSVWIEGFREGVLGLDVPIAEALVETVGFRSH